MEKDYSYISVELKPEFVGDVFANLLEASVAPAAKHDLHATLMYDERDIASPLCDLNTTREYRAHVTKLEVLGDGLVFHMTSPDMQDEFRRLRDEGYEHSFGTLLPHMSLAYKCDAYDILALQSVFSDWAGRELVFHNATWGTKKI